MALFLSAIAGPAQPAAAAGRCTATGGDVEQRVAAFWQCVGSLGTSDLLTAEDLGQWARNVTERAPGASIRVIAFRASTAGMQGALDRASAGVPSEPPKSADVEDRVARFWQKVNALGSCDKLTATDLGQWALNVIDRDPSRQIRVDDFRASTAGMQGGLDRASDSCSATAAPNPAPTAACRGVPFDPAMTGIDGYVTWDLQGVPGIEIVAVATDRYAEGDPTVASAVTDANGYWKLTGFTDLDRPYHLFTKKTDTYGGAGYGFNEASYDPSLLCADRIVHLDTGSGVSMRWDSLIVNRYIEGITLRSGASEVTWDPRAWWLIPPIEVPAGPLTVTWQALPRTTEYCVKLVDSTGGTYVDGPETCTTGTSHTFSGLVSGRTYYVWIRAWGISRKHHDGIGNEGIPFSVK